MSSMRSGREMTLAEAAYQYGHHHTAANQYKRLAHGIRMLDQCRWWEALRKYKIKRMLIDIIKEIDSIQ